MTTMATVSRQGTVFTSAADTNVYTDTGHAIAANGGKIPTMTHRMPPLRLANQTWRLRQLYRAAGYHVTEAGRVLAPPQSLGSMAKPPRLSERTPPTTRSIMTSPLPAQVESYSEIPTRLRPAYDLSVLGWYELNQVGAALSAYRAALAKDPHREPVARLRKLTKHEWSTLLSVAERGEERAYFMRAFTCKRIKLKD
jgi:hypothetical protein